MVKQARSFLNRSPYGIFLVRTQFDSFGCIHQLKVGTVIGRRHVGIESLVVEFGEHVAPFIVRPHPIQKRLPDFFGFLHGGGGQFLIDNHNGFSVFIMLAAFLLNLDGSVDKQGFKNLFRRIFGNTPHAVAYGHVPDSHFRQPASERGQIADLLQPLAAVQMFHKVRNDLWWNPGRAEFDADVHGLDVRRHGGAQRLHIGGEAGIRLRGFFRLCQFGPHIAGQVSVADFPFLTGGIEENLSLFPQFRLNVLRRTMQKLRHAAEIHPAVFPQGNEQGVSGIFRRFRHLSGLEYPLPENRGFFR